MATDTQISIRLTTEQLDRAQKLADKAGITRHKLLQNIVNTGIDTIEDLDSVGILGLTIFVNNVEKYWKGLFKKKEIDISKEA